ncbi:hypothetical protein [Streptomyces sasae]|uniref:hypothetical protein n=1 Tax=Streptomyces sasae TaxID=1266772 RepID=UPI00292D145D|nr:hypothetical protein [Streptomyces sasae]
MSESRDAVTAPPPDAASRVRAYGPRDVVRVNLHVKSRFYRGVVTAHYETADGRRAYRLGLYPRPDRAPCGWYWWDATKMTRRDYRRSPD